MFLLIIYAFKSAQYIFQFTSMNCQIILRTFHSLPGGHFTPRSHPVKFLKM